MFKQELKKQLIKNRLALLLIAVIVIDALYALSSSVRPNVGHGGFDDMLNDFSFHSAWTMFLNGSSINWALLIFTCVAALKIWVNEYSLNMQVYNLTSANGRARLAVKKVIITVGLVLSAAVVSEFLRIMMYGINLSYDNLPLAQCGWNYGTTELALTASQTCFISIPLHIVGYLFFCSLCILAAVVIRNSVNCLGVYFAVILIPLYIFDDLDARLRLPFPVSFLQGEKMFYGSSIDAATENTDNPVYSFKALSQGEIILNVILALLLIAAAISLSIVIFSGKRLKITKIKKRKALILPLTVLMLFSGCSSTLSQQEKSGYIQLDNSDRIYSKERDEVFSINPTPFTNRLLLHVYGNYAIVMEHVSPDLPNGSYYIKAVSLDDLSEKLLYVVGLETDLDGLMGLDDVISFPNWLFSDSDFYGYSSDFVFADNKLYSYGRKDILCIDLSNGRRTKLLQDVNFVNTTITDEGIYYMDKDSSMLYLNSEDTRICDFPISSYVAGDGATAVVNKEDNCLYLITAESTRKISETEVCYFVFTSDSVTVFVTNDGNTIAVDGDNEIFYEGFAFYADDDGVYFWDGESMKCRSY